MKIYFNTVVYFFILLAVVAAEDAVGAGNCEIFIVLY